MEASVGADVALAVAIVEGPADLLAALGEVGVLCGLTTATTTTLLALLALQRAPLGLTDLALLGGDLGGAAAGAAIALATVTAAGMGCQWGPANLGIVLGLDEGFSLWPSHSHADEQEAPTMAIPLLDPLEGPRSSGSASGPS